MKRYITIFLLLSILIAPIYAVSGFSVTIGEATNNNAAYKNTVLAYFQSKTEQNVSNADVKIITADEVNKISQNITGKVYPSSSIYSCALVDLNYKEGIKIVVDSSKITVVTPQMYANALKTSGIEKGYVVVTSPISATGEAALTGVLKSYETAVGADIPEAAKQAATEELYLETALVNETGASGDEIAALFSDVKNQTAAENLQDPEQIENIVNQTANNLNIDLNQNQTQQIANTVANSQQVQGNLTDFKEQLQDISSQVNQGGIMDQINSLMQWLSGYIQGLISGQ
ncbi:DUF1002 domain-containing protein [Methanobacterium alcaliphilum]|uniref:DUF1002 domain-containing protein n=1 Tax=Methanobacterium alcaliphilum TaxID=392018 RepID=UPI00200AA70D|nr:DUF1002 domain-containing protein [Methanobacterium alcaliphilum]MCK9150450.1 DUF1002 domain-containing protein [Methanobacterium alcaliphilum]